MEADEKACPKCAETIKAAAVVCKHCGYNFEHPAAIAAPNPAVPRRSDRKLAIGCVSVLGVLFLIGVIGSLNKPHTADATGAPADAQSPTPAPEALKVSALQLDRAYNANEPAAQQRYGDAILQVTGTINSINLDFTNDTYLVLTGENMFLGPQAHLTDASKSQAPNLAKGQKVTLLCHGVRFIVSTVQLSDCDLQ